MSDPTDSDSYGDYAVDPENQPQGDEASSGDDRGLVDPLDEGISPPEKWSAGQGWGNTALEQELGESFDQRLAQEEPEPDPYAVAEVDPDADPDAVVDGDVDDGEVGAVRSGRLVAPDEGLGEDLDQAPYATDIGIDGAGASAEEAAVHLVPEDGEDWEDDTLDAER